MWKSHIFLAGIVIRQIADLLSAMQSMSQALTPVTHMEVSQDDIYNVQVGRFLKKFQIVGSKKTPSSQLINLVQQENC